MSNGLIKPLPITNPGFADSKPLENFMVGSIKRVPEFLRTHCFMLNCLLEMTVQGWDIWIQSIESFHKAFKKRVATLCCHKIW